MSSLEALTANHATADRSRWDYEPSTLNFLARFPGEPGIYIVRHHSAYQQLVINVFKVGRCNALKARFKDYRGAMTLEAFMPSPFPRVVEMLILRAVRRFVICGLETLEMPLESLREVCQWAVREVALYWQPRCIYLAPHYHGFSQTIDRELRAAVKVRLLLNAEVRGYGGMTQQKGGAKACAKGGGKAGAKRKRDSWALVFQEIRCPYERLNRASKKRVAVSTTPDEAVVLEGLIKGANEEITDRLDDIVASGENILDALADERETMVRFDRPFWNGRAMEKVLPYVDELIKDNTPHDLNTIGAFLNEECVRDSDAKWRSASGPRTGLFEYSSVLYGDDDSGYVGWCSRNSVTKMNQKEFGGQMKLICGMAIPQKLKPGDVQRRAYKGIRLKTKEEKCLKSIGAFLKAMCVEGAYALIVDLYKAYVTWSKKGDMLFKGKKTFGMYMTRIYGPSISIRCSTGSHRGYRGVQLL